MWQSWVVIIVLAGAVGYAGYRIYRTLTNKNDACEGCALKDSCRKHGGAHGDHNCCEKCGSSCHKC
jgi:hypothetical protein